MKKFSSENIKKTAELLKDMLQPRAKKDTKPSGPSGIPKQPKNQTDTVYGEHELTEGMTDPGVVDGVTGTGGGQIIT